MKNKIVLHDKIGTANIGWRTLFFKDIFEILPTMYDIDGWLFCHDNMTATTKRKKKYKSVQKLPHLVKKKYKMQFKLTIKMFLNVSLMGELLQSLVALTHRTMIPQIKSSIKLHYGT